MNQNGNETFDLDRALERKPDLILVDDLAHSNGAGSRHRRRYQDIDELLKSGIDVYTTVNVGNIESLHDTVTSITGIATWDRIPDSVFDQADQVELIDIEPQELMEGVRYSRLLFYRGAADGFARDCLAAVRGSREASGG